MQIHIENIIDGGWIFPAEKPIFSKTDASLRNHGIPATPNTTTSPDITVTNDTNIKNDFEIGGFMLKRLPVRDGEHGYYRHVVLISMSDMKSVPLTMGQWEVTEILGWDEANENVYFMATPKLKPGQRHLYKISLTLNVTKTPNRIFVSSTLPMCMTCDNGAHTFKLLSNSSSGNASENFDSNIGDIPNNCLFNQCYFSKDYSYYIQECLGPATPSIYLVETSTMSKIVVLNSGELLRTRLSQLAIPQIRTVSVEIRHGFHAQGKNKLIAMAEWSIIRLSVHFSSLIPSAWHERRGGSSFSANRSHVRKNIALQISRFAVPHLTGFCDKNNPHFHNMGRKVKSATRNFQFFLRGSPRVMNGFTYAVRKIHLSPLITFLPEEEEEKRIFRTAKRGNISSHSRRQSTPLCFLNTQICSNC